MSDFYGFEVRNWSNMGRFVTAKRDYEIGDLILDEEPLLISPFGLEAANKSFQNSEDDENESTIGCLGCYKPLCINEIRLCHKCDFPVCSRECSENSAHTKYECSHFAEKKINLSAEALQYIYILRAALMYKDQENRGPWNMFASLSSSFDLNQPDFQAKTIKEIQKSTNFLNSHFQIDIDSSIVGQIIRTYTINGFRMEAVDKRGNSYRAKVLYSVGCLFDHSCLANADWVIHPIPYKGIKPCHLRIYARKNIFYGETINVSYISDCLRWGTAARKSYIAKHFHFDCKCLRCEDRTELFWYTEAVKCQFCDDETLTADYPGDAASTWTCDYCKGRSDYSYAEKCVETFKSSLASTMNSPSATALDLLLITSSNTRFALGQNHRERNVATFLWIQCLSQELFIELIPHSTESSQLFVKCMERSAKCLTMFRMFGRIALIVEMECCFARAIAAYYFKTTDFCSIHYDSYSREEKLKILSSICDHLQIGYDTQVMKPALSSGCISLRHVLITGFKFWKNELDAMENEEVHHKLLSIGFLRKGIMKVSNQIKACVGKLWALVCQLSGRSIVDSNVIKPDVSLLLQHDYYFNN